MEHAFAIYMPQHNRVKEMCQYNNFKKVFNKNSIFDKIYWNNCIHIQLNR